MMKMALLRRQRAQQDGTTADGNARTADGAGCAAVAVLMSEDFLICANCGDCRAILCRAGMPVELSHDHKPTDIRERERIEAAGGYIEERTVGSRVIHRVNGNLS